MSISKLQIVFLSLSLCSTSVFAETCTNFFKDKIVPKIKYDQMLCYDKFAVLYDYNYKIPVLSAEVLTSADVKAAKNISRKNAFHVDTDIPDQYNQTLADYKSTDYDRGHMTPSADMPTAETQYQSFSLANMTPQTAKLNQIVWRKIEEAVRTDVEQKGSAYVMTGSIINPNNMQYMNSVLIPFKIYKVVIFNDSSYVYVGDNDDSQKSEKMSISEFEQKYKIDVSE